jgi:hypothetical protein
MPSNTNSNFNNDQVSCETENFQVRKVEFDELDTDDDNSFDTDILVMRLNNWTLNEPSTPEKTPKTKKKISKERFCTNKKNTSFFRYLHNKNISTVIKK